MNTPRLFVVIGGRQYCEFGELYLAEGSARRHAATISQLMRVGAVREYQCGRFKVAPNEAIVSAVGTGLKWDVKRGRSAKALVTVRSARTGERS